METASKYLKRERIRARRNPGRRNRQERKEANTAKRGPAVPGTRVIEHGKAKARRRNRLKNDLRREINKGKLLVHEMIIQKRVYADIY